MTAQAHLPIHTQLLRSAQSVLQCFTSTETVWLIRDGGVGEERDKEGMRSTQAHLPVHTQLLSTAHSLLLPWCFMSTETVWLIRDGGEEWDME